MTQPTLFDPEQRAELARVTGATAGAILNFLRRRLANGFVQFHADDLRGDVACRLPTAPASADRVLRDLRRAGIVSYIVVNRRASLYRVLSVR
jgi:hypothetical protein